MQSPILSVRQVVLAESDPFGLWQEVCGDPNLKDPPDAFNEFLAERGQAWEREILARRHAKWVDLSDLSFDRALDETRRALRPGAPPVYQGAVFDETLGVRGRPDLLVRAPERIRVEEYKLAGEAKVDHLMQAVIYADLVHRAFELPVDALVVTRLGEETAVHEDPDMVTAAVRRAREILDSPRPPAPRYNCRRSQWVRLQNEEAIRGRDVSLAIGVGTSMSRALRSAGLRTLDDLATADDDTLRALSRVGHVKARKARRSAAALAANEVLRVGPWRVEIETPTLELFIDLESSGELFQDDPSWNCLYLTGAIARPRGGRTEPYHAFLAKRPDEEGPTLAAFLGYLEERKDYALYHWSHFERTQLRKSCGRHGWEDRYRALVEPYLVDLCDRAQKAFVLPLPGWSIKLVAPYFGFNWTYGADEISAMTSAVVWFRQAEAGGTGDRLDKVLQYNADDCRAMVAVKDGLARLDREVPWEVR